MPTAKELGELERLKQNEVSLKSKIRSVSLRKMLFLATLQQKNDTNHMDGGDLACIALLA